MFFSRPAGYKYIDRGDPDAFDITLIDIIADGDWRELDLSALVPKNAKRVRIHLALKTPTPSEQATFFDVYGKVYHYCISCCFTIGAGIITHWTVELSIASNGIILYNALPGCSVWDLTVGGWWI